MANNNVQKITFAFEADTNKAKQSINDLFRTLEKVASEQKVGDFNFDEKLDKAAQSAVKLGQHLKNAVDVNTGKLDLSRLNQSLKKSGDSFKELKQNLWEIDGIGVEAFNQIDDAISAAEPAMVRINKHLSNFLTTLKNTAKWQLTSNITHGLESSLSKAYNYAKDLNQSLNNIRIVTGQSSAEMADFAKQANKAAQSLSTSTLNYTDAALIYYQQGLTGQDVTERTDTTIKLANVTGQSAQEVSSYMTAVWNNFDDGSKKLEYFADVITALGASTASSSAEIAEGLGKFASVADTVGLSYEYATSALATIVAQTRQSADTVGTGLRTILARLESINLGETLDDGVTLTKYTKALEAVGVQVLDTNGELKKADQILNEIAGVWNNISETQQQSLAYTVGGVRQYTNLVALFDNWDQMQKNISTAMGAEGTVDKQAKIYEESWKAANQRVKASLEEIYDNIINDDFFISMTDGFAKVISFVDKLVDSLGGVQGILTIIGAVITKQYSKEIPSLLNNLKTNISNFIGIGRKQGLNFAEKINEQVTPERMELLKSGKDAEGKDVSNVGAAEEYASHAKLERSIALEKERANLTEEEYNHYKAINEVLDKQDANIVKIAKNRADALQQAQKEVEVQEELNIKLKENQEKLNDYTQKSAQRIADGGAVGKHSKPKTKITKLTNIFGGLDSALETEGADKEKIKAFRTEYNALIQDLEQGNMSKEKYQFRLKNLNDAYDAAKQTTKEYTKLKSEETQIEKDNANSKKILQQAENDANEAQKALNNTLEQNEEKLKEGYNHNVSLGESLTNLASGIMLTLGAMQSINSAFDTLGDQEATVSEKMVAVISAFATTGMAVSTLGKGLNSFITVLQKSADKAEFAWIKILGPIGKVFIIIGALTALGIGLAHIINPLTKATKNLDGINSSIDNLSDRINGLQDEITSMGDAFNSWEQGITELDKLTKGTNEYAQKLKEVNDQARDLIEQYDLIRGKDYTYQNGVIEISRQAWLNKIDQLKTDKEQLEIKKEYLEITKIAAEGEVNELKGQTGAKEEAYESGRAKAEEIVRKRFEGEDSQAALLASIWSRDVSSNMYQELDEVSKNANDTSDISWKEAQELFNLDENSDLGKVLSKDWGNLNDDNLAKLYAYKVLGMSEEDAVHLNYKGERGKGTFTVNGEEKTFTDAEMRRELHLQHQLDKIKEKYDDEDVAQAMFENAQQISSDISNLFFNDKDLANNLSVAMADAWANSDPGEIIAADLNSVFAGYSEEAIQEYLERLKTAREEATTDQAKESYTSLINGIESLDRGKMDEVVNDRYEKEAEALKIDVEAFKTYRDILIAVNPKLFENSTLANECAMAGYKLKIAYDDLDKSFTKWNKGMTSNNLQDVAEVIPEIKTNLQQLLNTQEDFDNKFVTENWDLVKGFYEGEADALDDLRDKYSQWVMDSKYNLDILTDSYSTALKNIENIEDNEDFADIEVGVNIKDEDFLQQWNQIKETLENDSSVKDAGAALATLAESLGYLITTSKNAQGGIDITNIVKGAGYSGKGSDAYNSATERAAINEANKKLFESFKSDRDPFHDVNISLGQLAKNIDKVSKKQSHLFGADLIKSLKTSNKLLQQQNQLYTDKINIAKTEAQAIKSRLEDEFSVAFNGDQISDYNTALKEAAQAVQTLYNQKGEGAYYEAQVKQAEKHYNDLKSYMDKYDQYINETIPELNASIEDNVYQQIANNLQAFEVKINLTLDKESLKREIIDFFGKINENFKQTYKQTEDWLALFDRAGQKMTSYSSTVQTDLDKIKTVQDIINDNNYDYTSPSAMFASKSEAIEYLKEASKTLMSDSDAMYNNYKQAWEDYLNAIDEVESQWEDILAGFDRVAKDLDHSAKLIELISGGSETDQGRQQLSQLYAAQGQNSLNTQSTLAAEIEALTKERQELMAQGASETDKDIKALDDAIAKASDNLQSEIENYIQIIKAELENSIRIAKESMDNSILGGSVKDVQQEWNDKKAMAESYYDSVEKVYQIETMESKWEASLGKASTLKSQQLITAAMEKQISALEEKGRLSEKDIELANKELLVLEAQAALEDAQNNKNSIKLVRGADGNWNYQYVVDDADVAKKQQDLLDKMNDYRTFAINTSEELTEKYINNYAQFSERMAQIEADTTLSEEERAVKMEELTNTYWGPEGILTGLMEENALFQQAANEATYLELAGLYEKDQENYNRMTDAEKDIVDGFKEHNDNTYTALWDFVNGINDDILDKCIDVNQQSSEAWSDMAANAMDNTKDIQSIVQEAYTEMELAQTRYDKHISESEKASRQSWSNIAKGIDQATLSADKFADKIDEITDKTDRLSEFAQYVNDIGKEWDDVKDKVADNISELERYIDLLDREYETEQKLEIQRQNNTIPSEALDTTTTGNQTTAATDNKTVNKEPSKTTHSIYGGAYAGGTASATYYGNGQYGSYTTTVKKTPAVATSNVIPTSDNEKIQNAKNDLATVIDNATTDKYGNTYYHYGKEVFGDLLNLKQAIAADYKVDWLSLDTGGYTGSWSGGDGRLAMLHSKELVLNAQDTENLLAAVNTIRGLNDAIEGSIQNRMAGMVAAMNGLTRNSFSGFGSNSETNNNTFNITAEFPNANDVNEIREAILSLPNLASQYLGRNN